MQAKERILVALDTSDLGVLSKYARALAPHVGGFKLGLEVMHAIGLPAAVNAVRGYGPNRRNVFADAKLCDIPNTVAGAARSIAALPEVAWLNVHASCGVEAMRAAVKVKGQAKVLAVTVLTSIGRDEIFRLYGRDEEPVATMAKMALEAGVDGLICSPADLEILAEVPGAERLLKVTPGVRPAWAAANDQKRVLTPRRAIEAGADYLVIGRPITEPPEKIGSPVVAAQLIAEEIASAGAHPFR